MSNDQDITPAMRKPIYGTDLSKPLSKLMEGWRSEIANIRGQMHDVGFAFRGWREEMAPLEGGLTCMLVAMHNSLERLRESEALIAKADARRAALGLQGE